MSQSGMSVQQLEQSADESNKVQSQLVAGRARSSTMYAEKVRQKRLQRGLSVGKFVAKAEKDVVAFTKYLSEHRPTDTVASVQAERLSAEAGQQAADHQRQVKSHHKSSRTKMLHRLNARRESVDNLVPSDGQAAMESFKATATGVHDASQPHPLGVTDDHTFFEVAVTAVEEQQDAVAAFLSGLGEGDSDPSTPPDGATEQNVEQHDVAAVPDVYDFLRGLDSDSGSDTDADGLDGYLKSPH